MSSGGFRRPRLGDTNTSVLPPPKRRVYVDDTIEYLGSVPLPTARRGGKRSQTSSRGGPHYENLRQVKVVVTRIRLGTDNPTVSITAGAKSNRRQITKCAVEADAGQPISDANQETSRAPRKAAAGAQLQQLQKRRLQPTSDDGDSDADASNKPKAARKTAPLAWTAFLSTLTSSPEWRPMLDRSRILTDQELDVLWFYGSNRNPKGHNLTPDYILALLAIGSWEEQETLMAYFTEHRFEEIHPDDNKLSAGHIRLQLDLFAAADPAVLMPNLESSPRTFCFGCKSQTNRSDLHRFCATCGAKKGQQLCPLNGLCCFCRQMTLADLSARYKSVCAAVRDRADKIYREKAELPRSLCTQYDCNVRTLEKLAAKGKTHDTIPPGLTRPAVALDIWKPPPPDVFDDVEIPDKADSVKPVYLAGRYGARRTSKAESMYADERRMVAELPPPRRGTARWLTLTEVKRLHEQYQRPMKPQEYGRKECPTPIRNHLTALMCRRPYHAKSDQRMAAVKRLRVKHIKQVMVKYAVPVQVIQLGSREETFVIPLCDGRYRMADRDATGHITRHRKEKAVIGPLITCQSPPPGVIMDRQVALLEAGEIVLPYVSESDIDAALADDDAIQMMISNLADVQATLSPSVMELLDVVNPENEEGSVTDAIALPMAAPLVVTTISSPEARRAVAAVMINMASDDNLSNPPTRYDDATRESRVCAIAISQGGDRQDSVVGAPSGAADPSLIASPATEIDDDNVITAGSSIRTLAELASKVCAQSEHVGRQLPVLQQQLEESLTARSAVGQAEAGDKSPEMLRMPSKIPTRHLIRELFLRRRQLESRGAASAFETFQLDVWIESIPEAQLEQVLLDACRQLWEIEHTVTMHNNADETSEELRDPETMFRDNAASLPGNAE